MPRHIARVLGFRVLGTAGIPFVAVLFMVLLAPVAEAATGEPASITPGVAMLTPLSGRTAASCTAAFVFAGAGATYLGYAAHCAAEEADTSRSGCVEDPLPLGSPVTIVGRDGSRTAGRLAYSSWRTMQDRGETDESVCELNDFALVEVDPAAVGRIDPTVPELGGPTGLDTDGTVAGEAVVSYQPNNPGRELKRGRSLGDSADGRTHRVRTSPAGNPGDSGSGYLDGDGRAFGVLSTQFQDERHTNGVADLALALSYAITYGDVGQVELVLGSEPFRARL